MPKRGRPSGFDRDVALRCAMDVFWSKGYEGTQVADLTAAMGINPPSFYAAFGSKKEAFLRAVALYVETIGARSVAELDEAPTVREGIRAMLLRTIEVACSTSAGGCLTVLGVVNNLPENMEVWERLRQERVNMADRIRDRLCRGIAEGDLPADADTDVLAAYFLGVTQTISFQARDGAPRAALEALVEPALAALPDATTSPPVGAACR